MKVLALENQTQQEMIHKALTVDSKWIKEVIDSSAILLGHSINSVVRCNVCSLIQSPHRKEYRM